MASITLSIVSGTCVSFGLHCDSSPIVFCDWLASFRRSSCHACSLCYCFFCSSSAPRLFPWRDISPFSCLPRRRFSVCAVLEFVLFCAFRPAAADISFQCALLYLVLPPLPLGLYFLFFVSSTPPPWWSSLILWVSALPSVFYQASLGRLPLLWGRGVWFSVMLFDVLRFSVV